MCVQQISLARSRLSKDAVCPGLTLGIIGQTSVPYAAHLLKLSILLSPIGSIVKMSMSLPGHLCILLVHLATDWRNSNDLNILYFRYRPSVDATENAHYQADRDGK
jgi:hypothetical protein